jgi:hypothetical protein
MRSHAKEAENYVLACSAYVDRLSRAYLAMQVENARLREGTELGEAAARDQMQRTNLAVLAAENDKLRAALLDVARRAEALKRPCGMDPESGQAIRNGEYMCVALAARAALDA